jgi:hypothetical protein
MIARDSGIYGGEIRTVNTLAIWVSRILGFDAKKTHHSEPTAGGYP